MSYPERLLATDPAGWLTDEQTGRWVRSSRLVGKTIQADDEGWLYTATSEPVEEAAEVWAWPEAWEPVGYIGDGSYIDLHPTRYNWRADVEEVARYLVDTYGIWANTYVGHPPPELVGGVYYDTVSLDGWDYSGRGNPISYELGNTAFYDIFNNGEPPWIRWCIWQGWIWDDWSGWQKYWDYDFWSDGQHVNHFHITFW